jgi:hypothetical protein
MYPSGNNVNAVLRCGDSSGVDSGANDYAFHTSLSKESSSSYYGWASAGRDGMQMVDAVGNAAGEGFGAMIYLSRPGDGTVPPIFSGTQCVINDAGIIKGGHFVGFRQSVITLDRIQFLFSEGNVTSGRLTVWGIAHA